MRDLNGAARPGRRAKAYQVFGDKLAVTGSGYRAHIGGRDHRGKRGAKPTRVLAGATLGGTVNSAGGSG